MSQTRQSARLVVTRRGLRFRGRYFPCSIGRGGVSSSKTEGDGASPHGLHRITGMLYRPDRMASPAPWARPIRLNDIWIDDPRSSAYNQLSQHPEPSRHERLWRADLLYDLVLLTDWNWPEAIPGRGSAIFVHRWRRPGFPTEGCVALHPQHLQWLAARITLGTALHIK